MIKYFKGSIFFSVLGFLLVAFLGFMSSGSISVMFETVFITLVLSILEVSLSFDNAIVNALVLKKMTPLWQKRFLTWGMVIAVFGMRFILPLVIVAIVGHVSPWESLRIALFDHHRYAEMMRTSHVVVSSFGGIFLLMVALKYFVDQTKDNHWVKIIEAPLAKLGKLDAIETSIALSILLILSRFVPENHASEMLTAGVLGLMVFLLVDALGQFLEGHGVSSGDLEKASFGLFLYLEVLDASFSFDGVIGSFAISNNLLIIVIGLSIGALFVRSLTVLFVEKNTLDGFEFLEHGAFYAIGTLSLSMLLGCFIEIPEWITGISGALIIALSIYSSILSARRKQAQIDY